MNGVNMNIQRREAAYEAALATFRPELPIGDPEQLAAMAAAAVEAALTWQPTAPEWADDGGSRLVMRYRDASTTGQSPADGPQPPPGGRWSCNCEQSACELRWGRVRILDSDGITPLDRLEVVCLRHDLSGRSHAMAVEEGGRVRIQRVQALHELDLAHAEQCR
jgi:hypothetical protein